MGPREPKSTVLTSIEEAMIVAFRQRTLLRLDDVMGCLRDQIPKLGDMSSVRLSSVDDNQLGTFEGRLHHLLKALNAKSA